MKKHASADYSKACLALLITSLACGITEAKAIPNKDNPQNVANIKNVAAEARSSLLSNPGDVVKLLTKRWSSTMKDPELLFLIGRASQELKKDVDALIYFTMAMTINPNHRKSIISRGLVRGALKDLAGAEEDFNMALLKDPNDPTALLNRGVTLAALGKSDAAINDFTKAAKLQPSKPESHRNRGITYYLLGKQKEACADWSTAEKLGDAETKEWIKSYCGS